MNSIFRFIHRRTTDELCAATFLPPKGNVQRLNFIKTTISSCSNQSKKLATNELWNSCLPNTTNPVVRLMKKRRNLEWIQQVININHAQYVLKRTIWKSLQKENIFDKAQNVTIHACVCRMVQAPTIMGRRYFLTLTAVSQNICKSPRPYELLGNWCALFELFAIYPHSGSSLVNRPHSDNRADNGSTKIIPAYGSENYMLISPQTSVELYCRTK